MTWKLPAIRVLNLAGNSTCCPSRRRGGARRHQRLDADVVEVDAAQAGQGQGDVQRAGVGDLAEQRQFLPWGRVGESDGQGLAAGAVVEESAVGRGRDLLWDADPGADLHDGPRLKVNDRAGDREQGTLEGFGGRSLGVLWFDLQHQAL